MRNKYLLTALISSVFFISACQNSADNGPIANAPIDAGGTLIEGETSSNNPANIAATNSNTNTSTDSNQSN